MPGFPADLYVTGYCPVLTREWTAAGFGYKAGWNEAGGEAQIETTGFDDVS